MLRTKVKNKDTGQEKLVWENIQKGDKDFHYYNDIECTDEIDMSQWEEIEESSGGIPFNMFGIECGKGWIPLIKPVIEKIDEFNNSLTDPEEKIEILQIKEKWGYLHFYISYGTREIYDMIEKAEDESTKVCEFCGSREHLGMTQGYYMTVCHDCIKRMCKERNFGSYQWHSYDDENVYWIHPDKDDELISTAKEYEESMP